METWLQTMFPLLPNGEVIVYRTPRGIYGYDPARAATDFAGITAPPTHAALSVLPIAQQGWQRIFDAWKAQGLVQ